VSSGARALRIEALIVLKASCATAIRHSRHIEIKELRKESRIFLEGCSTSNTSSLLQEVTECHRSGRLTLASNGRSSSPGVPVAAAGHRRTCRKREK